MKIQRSAVWRVFLVATLLLGLMGTVWGAPSGTDTFEDGDTAEYSVDSGNFYTQQSNVFEGSYSARLEASSGGTDGQVQRQLSSLIKPSNLTVSFYYSSGGSFGVGWDDEDVMGRRFALGAFVDDTGDIWICDDTLSSSTEVVTGSYGQQWVTVKLENIDWSNQVVGSYKVDGTEVATNVPFCDSSSDGDGSPNGIDMLHARAQGSSNSDFGLIDNWQYQSDNSAPSIDSTLVEPSDPLLGDTFSKVRMNTSDPDGDDVTGYVNYTITGSPNSFLQMDEPTPNEHDLDNILDVGAGADKWYNITFIADDGQSGTSNVTNTSSFYINDTKPNVTLNSPSGNVFSYNASLNFTVKNTDDVPTEDYNCDINQDGSLVETVFLKEGTNSTYTRNLSSDLGSHTANVSCTDGNGNTGVDNTSYTVNVSDFQFVRNISPVYETENITYDTILKVGDMVNNITNNLYWNNSRRNTVFVDNNGINNYTISNYQEIPLVDSNASSFNWSSENIIKYDKFSSGTTDQTVNSSNQNQTVYHAFSIQNQTLDDTAYVEFDDIVYTSYLRNHTGKADINADITYTQDDYTENKDLPKTSGLSKYRKFSQTMQSTEVDYGGNPSNPANETAYTNTSYTISFNNDSRTIVPSNLSAQIQKITIQKCSGQGQTALNFTTYNENDRDQKVFSNFRGSWNAKNLNNLKFSRSFNFTSTNKTSHEFCIIPGNAEFLIDTQNKKIVYDFKNSTYTARAYYLINETISNDTTNIPLYMLKTSDASEVEFSVEDTSGNDLSQIVIESLRYFPGSDKFLTVAMSRTGTTGTTRTFLEFNEIDYKFKLYKDKKLLKETDQQVLPQDLKILLTIGEERATTYYDQVQNINFRCTNNISEVRCDYNGRESISNVSLEVAKDESIGFAKEDDPATSLQEYCLTSSNSSSATLICTDLNASTNRYRYSLNVQFNDGSSLGLDSGFIGQLTSDPFGNTGLFVYFMMFVTMSFAGLWKPEATIMLGMLSTVLAAFTGFLVLSQTALISIIALGAVTIWRMS